MHICRRNSGIRALSDKNRDDNLNTPRTAAQKRALQNEYREAVPILKGSFERGENDKQYVLQGEILEGELISLFPVDDVIIRGNYVQSADFL